MTSDVASPVDYYPDFDRTQVDEVIAPLAPSDDEVAAVLAAGGTGGAKRTADAGTLATVAKWLDGPEHYPFQRVIKGIAAAVADTAPLDSFPELLADPQAILTQLLERTEVRLQDVCTRPLVAAVNHARKRGVLRGATAEERYRDFVRQSVRTSFEDASGLSFPVLRSVKSILIRNEVDSFRELCVRLTTDRGAIEDTFGIGSADPLVHLGRPEGDTHNHGRSVSVLGFRSGRRLVYKPRDVSCEAAWVTIAGEVNTRVGTTLAAATVLERDSYGYAEYVEVEDVADMSADFMDACGELAAVLWVLNARDMHLENILPTRRGPLPIDLETILHPERIYVGAIPEAPGNAQETVNQSVYGIGILPLVMAGRGKDAGHVDLGFLGDQNRGNSPFRAMRMDHPFTDHVRLSLQATPAAERRTVVSALTEDEVHELGRRMADGFSRVFRAVMAEPDSWAALLRKTVAGVRVRYLHNPTVLYGQMLRMTSGPSALDDTGSYSGLLKRVAMTSKTSDRRIVRSELRQLAERDVPYFAVASTGTVLTDGDGTELGASFPESPLDSALAKIARISEFELDQQLRLIHSAFASRFPDNHLTPAGGVAAQPAAGRAGSPARRDAIAALVTRLCDDLLATSRPDQFADQPRTWIGPVASAEVDRPWPPGVLGYDLYTGRTGPALALAAAARVLDDGRYRDLAVQIFSATVEVVSTYRDDTRALHRAGYGAFTGMAGVLFALSAAGRLLEEDAWTLAAQDAVPLVLEQVREARRPVPLDVVEGLAGVVSCVAAVGGDSADAAVPILTALLLDSLATTGDGPDTVFDQSGFAHGVSGVLYALSRVLPRLEPDLRRSAESALAGLAGRLHTFHEPAEGNWYTNVAAPRAFATGWCHGPGGIAAALSCYAAVSGDGDVSRLRDEAVDTLFGCGFGRNLTWCHGDLGNHDVLTGLAGIGGGPWRARIAEVERTWLQPEVFDRKLGDIRSRYSQTSSLMVGTAGIVLHLANRLDPAARVSPVTLTIWDR